jgi:predicted transcriptional regulator
MNRTLNLGMSLAAGLLGGLLSHYAAQSVLAQSQVTKEIRSQSFVLVNDKGVPSGAFGFDKDGNASITLFDKSGNVIWSENGKANPRRLAENISK